MKIVPFFISILIILAFEFKVFSQNINPNGYNKFLYPNGKVSSEGVMKNGQTVGIWKSYYPNGILKTIGKRLNNKPDSTWKFYDENSNLTEIINYKENLRNGYCYTYMTVNDSITFKNILKSKELFVSGKKYGKSFFYNDNENLVKTTMYDENLKHGKEVFYDSTGLIISILQYSYGNVVDAEEINRKDVDGKKFGIWKEFYPNENIKVYSNYENGKLNGYYREYDSQGRITKSEYYIDGVLTDLNKNTDDNVNNDVVEKKETFLDGKIKYTGKYVNGKPVGIHKQYNKKGEIEKVTIYNNKGFVTAIGNYNKTGKRNGKWIFKYPSGNIRAEGIYKNNRKTGKWKYYHLNGKTEQVGKYLKGRPQGHWKWYFSTGKIRREGNFSRGKENGIFYELSSKGDTISVGEYVRGVKEKFWKYKVNDYLEEGNYNNGQKDGIWKNYYLGDKKKLRFEGKYVEGKPDGKHKYYYPNGKTRLLSYYDLGRKIKTWRKFDTLGNIETTFKYRYGELYKIDGQKVEN